LRDITCKSKNTLQCTVEGYNLVFQERPSPADGLVGKESYAQVEVGGQILGKGVGLTWEEAKLQVISSLILTQFIFLLLL